MYEELIEIFNMNEDEIEMMYDVCEHKNKFEKIYLQIQIDFDGKELFIAKENSSGCSYEIESKEELLEHIIGYVMDCIDPKFEFDFELKKKGSETYAKNK